MSRPKFTAEFWDRLSFVEVTEESLAELDRRSKWRRREAPNDDAGNANLEEASAIRGGRDVNKFAMHGGPNMVLALEQWERSRPQQSPRPPHNRWAHPRFPEGNFHFAQHLLDHRLHLEGSSDGPLPEDFERVRVMIRGPLLEETRRDYLSAYNWPNTLVTPYQEYMAPRGGQFVRPRNDPDHLNRFFGSILPIMDYPNQEIDKKILTQYKDVRHATSRTVHLPCPDFVDGSIREKLHPKAFRDAALRQLISVDGSLEQEEGSLILPNFVFDEGPSSHHACYAAAFGARAMHAIKSQAVKLTEGRLRGLDLTETPLTPADLRATFNRKVLSFSAVMWQGVLTLYTHHMENEEGKVHLYMTRIGSYEMGNTDRPWEFRNGARAFSNMRSLAKMKRDSSIHGLNEEYLFQGHVPAVDASD